MLGKDLGDISRDILDKLDKLEAAGLPPQDALTCLHAYHFAPDGADGIRAKAVLEEVDRG